MSNPSKAKGTKFETKIVNEFNKAFGGGTVGGVFLKRTPASSRYDAEAVRPTNPEYEPTNILVTQPDYGRALVTMSLVDFFLMYGVVLDNSYDGPLHVEMKKLGKIALHSIYEDKFGRQS